MTLQELEALAKSLRPFRLSYPVSLTLSKALTQALDPGPLKIHPEDVQALMSPRRPPRTDPAKTPEVQQRRAAMRQAHPIQTSPGTYTVHHHPADYRSALSHIQYHLSKAKAAYTTAQDGDRALTYIVHAPPAPSPTAP